MENKLVKKIILDTDMGVDCDDAVALAILLNKHIAGEIQIGCITASSTREGATATVQAITNYYGVHLPIGAMAPPSLECDKINNYGKAIKELYGTQDSTQDAVSLLSKTLAQQEGKCTIAAIGPLSNMERLLKSGADEISPLDGEGLVREKVSEIFVMGGRFAQNYDFLELHVEVAPEWNILQDIKSAQYVAENFPSRMLFCPFEAGENVFTAMGKSDNPVWECMKRFVISGGEPFESDFVRPSWDPVTCLCALGKDGPYFIRSAFGKIRIDDGGVSTFRECGGGNARILLIKENSADIAELINGEIEPV